MTVVASNYATQKNSLYETEDWRAEAFLRHFPMRGASIWEPAAGNHAIVDVLKKHGASSVLATDIVEYDREHDAIIDFLDETDKLSWGGCLITNPPYGKQNRDAVKFAELALQRCSGIVALLLTANFDFDSTRAHLFQDNPRFRSKIVLMDGDDLAWYVWGASGDEEAAPTIIYERRTTVCAGEVATR